MRGECRLVEWGKRWVVVGAGWGAQRGRREMRTLRVVHDTQGFASERGRMNLCPAKDEMQKHDRRGATQHSDQSTLV